MIGIIASEIQKKELLKNGSIESQEVVWLSEPQNINGISIYTDLLFDNNEERINILKQSTADCVIINYVTGTLNHLPAHFIRFNAWPTFLSRPVIECALSRQDLKPMVEKFFALFGKKVIITPDQPGFISTKIIAMIINEAFRAVEEGVSTKEETDVAMKTGTNYPFGPFEWGTAIGLDKVYQLLLALAAKNERYAPANLLSIEAQKK